MKKKIRKALTSQDIIKRGRSNKLAYTSTPPRKAVHINMQWLSEVVSDMACKVDTAINVADLFTKPLDEEAFARHTLRMGVVPAAKALWFED